MSITFYATGADDRPVLRCTCEDMTCAACESSLNVHNGRAAMLLVYLGFDRQAPNMFGRIRAAELVARCEERLARLEPEPEIAPVERGRLYVHGRPAGNMRDTTARLLAVARAAGAGWVVWS